MLDKKDNETLQEVMMAFHAKNKLEEITKFLKDHKDDSLSTKEMAPVGQVGRQSPRPSQ